MKDEILKALAKSPKPASRQPAKPEPREDRPLPVPPPAPDHALVAVGMSKDGSFTAVVSRPPRPGDVVLSERPKGDSPWRFDPATGTATSVERDEPLVPEGLLRAALGAALLRGEQLARVRAALDLNGLSEDVRSALEAMAKGLVEGST